MNVEQLAKVKNNKGFIAALDQSGGSTPKALSAYGVTGSSYTNTEQMYDLVHAMRTRIITSPIFDDRHILGAILFKKTMRGQVDGLNTADYLWQRKGIVPFLKIDEGLTEQVSGVQLMKLMPELAELLNEAKNNHIFGTKMRSFIKEYNERGIKQIIDQQFEVARQIIAAELVPIIEPEIDIYATDKATVEALLRDLLLAALDTLTSDEIVMLKLTIPNEDNFYTPLIDHPNVLRVVALSGGYTRREANEKLARNHGLIASFSRALSENLRVDQSDDEFDNTLQQTIAEIYTASIT